MTLKRRRRKIRRAKVGESGTPRAFAPSSPSDCPGAPQVLQRCHLWTTPLQKGRWWEEDFAPQWHRLHLLPHRWLDHLHHVEGLQGEFCYFWWWPALLNREVLFQLTCSTLGGQTTQQETQRDLRGFGKRRNRNVTTLPKSLPSTGQLLIFCKTTCTVLVDRFTQIKSWILLLHSVDSWSWGK